MCPALASNEKEKRQKQTLRWCHWIAKVENRQEEATTVCRWLSIWTKASGIGQLSLHAADRSSARFLRCDYAMLSICWRSLDDALIVHYMEARRWPFWDCSQTSPATICSRGWAVIHAAFVAIKFLFITFPLMAFVFIYLFIFIFFLIKIFSSSCSAVVIARAISSKAVKRFPLDFCMLASVPLKANPRSTAAACS